MNVLSLFDGMSCGRIALERANIHVDNYYASEIKAKAIKVTKDNYPDTIHIGDVTKIDLEALPHIDALFAGSPCQDFTQLKNKEDRKGMYGDKSVLFFSFLNTLRFLREKNPDLLFIFENVKMTPEHQSLVSFHIGCDPIAINSNLLTYQNRHRLYWTNIKGVEAPEDKGISFQDYKETDHDLCKARKVNRTPSRIKMWEKQCPNVTYREKINCLTCKQDRRNNSGLIEFEDFCRYLTRREMEQAQTVPIGYTDCLSINQAEDVLGDGWTVDVIAHILSYIVPSKSM